MGKETVLFQSEEMMNIQDVSDFLHKRADKLAHRQIIFCQGIQELEVSMPDRVIFELKTEEESKKEKVQ